MKTLQSIVFGLALIIACTAAKAINKPVAAVLTKNDVLNIYVNAVVHGKLDGLENVLDKNVRYTIHRGENDINLSKKDVLESLKATENVEQGCTYTTSVVKDTPKGMVVKLDMKYDGYVRTSLITISLDHDDFRITKIETQS